MLLCFRLTRHPCVFSLQLAALQGGQSAESFLVLRSKLPRLAVPGLLKIDVAEEFLAISAPGEYTVLELFLPRPVSTTSVDAVFDPLTFNLVCVAVAECATFVVVIP